MRIAIIALLISGCATTKHDLPGSPPQLIHREGNQCTWVDSTEGETITYTENCEES